MGSAKTEAYEREMKGKKENQTGTKSNIIIIHVLPRKEENTETDPMTWQDNFLHHHCHPHALFKDSRVADVCCIYVSSFLFFCVKRQHHP
jgi:hypothetical protein